MGRIGAVALVGACGSAADLPTAAGELAPLHLRSPAYADGAEIPVANTCDGEDLSPPLAWDAPPEGTVGFTVALTDPDAKDTVHWIAWDLGPDSMGLPEGIAADDPLLVQGDSFAGRGYHGPCPPVGDDPHHYDLRVWAVDQRVGLSAGAELATVYGLLDGHVLGLGELTGTYGR